MDKAAVVAGENMVVHCPVAGYPIDSIVWEKSKYCFMTVINNMNDVRVKYRLFNYTFLNYIEEL